MLPSYTQYSHFKYQIGYRMHIDDAITAIREAKENICFNTGFHSSFIHPDWVSGLGWQGRSVPD